MVRTVVNSILVAAVAGLVSLNVLLTIDPARRNVEIFPDMARSARYGSFARNANFRDGMTLRQPVAGTVIRGFMPLHYTAAPQDAIRAGLELHNPFGATDPRVLQRGAAVYTTYCEICHGVAGKGDGPVALRGFPAPPSLLAPHALGLADGQIFHIVTFGQKNMPSYAAQVDRADRWRAIVYVRSLQRSAPPPPLPSAAGQPGRTS